MQQLTIDDMKAIELSIMDEIDRVCREHGLRYFLAYGSLIGAARHQGFIPWDDDMDIMMPRADYEVFAAHFDEWRSDARFAAESYRDGVHYSSFVKVVDNTTAVRENFLRKDIVSGVWVDVFPLDWVGENCEATLKKIGRLSWARSFAVADPNVGSSALVRLVKKIVCPLVAGRDPREYSRRIDELAQTCGDEKTATKVGYLFDGLDQGLIHDRACFDQVVDLPFEGRSSLAPAAYDELLTQTYGDWRTPPAQGSRANHTFEAVRLDDGEVPRA